MKKVLILILAAFLILTGFFFLRGGHHAIVLADQLEDYLDADRADQLLSIQIETPDKTQYSLRANSFWTEYGDDGIFGLTLGDATVYLRRGILYTDTGKAYSLPKADPGHLAKLAAGLLLHGRVTKEGDAYHLTMVRPELELSASFLFDPDLREITLSVRLPDETALRATLTPEEPQQHPIPRTVSDAMVLSKMEPPPTITEPLSALLPLWKNLFPLSGTLDLNIACGILKLSEQVVLAIDNQRASLTREGVTLDLGLPQGFHDLSPIAGSLLLLRHGDLSESGVITVTIPDDAATELLETLIPQAAGLGIKLSDSRMIIRYSGSHLTGADLSAEGSVPFLLTTIPVSFSASFTP